MDMVGKSNLPRVVVLGGGLGGTIATYEMAAGLRGRAEIMLLSNKPDFSFVPSNPWVAVNWRKPDEITVPLAPIMKRKGIGFSDIGAKRLHPEENRIELNDGTDLSYDYLVIATGPALAFDEVPGLGRPASRHPSAKRIMRAMPRMHLSSSPPIPDQSSSALRPAHRASAPPMNSR